MVKFCKIIVGGVTIKDDSSGADPKKALKWEYDKDDDNPISEAVITCSRDVEDLITLTNNLNVQIYSSPDNTTFTRIFYGVIDNYQPQGALVELNCKNQLYDLVRRNVNNIYDSNVDAFAGKISDIAEDLIQTYGGLTATVQDSGTEQVVDVFKCVNTDIFERVQALTSALDWVLYWDDKNAIVKFEPRSFVNSEVTLTTSGNIVNVPKWDIDTTHMINRLRIDGATTQTQITETGKIGTTADYTTASILLTKTPDNAELYIDANDPPTTQKTGGSKDGTTGGDYWVDRENKKITPQTAFTTDHFAIINYFWSSPAPIEMENSESIVLYGLYEKTIELSDVTSVADAEARAVNILSRRSLPFYVGSFLVKSTVDIGVGELVTIQDNITQNAPNGNYMISKIKYSYPNAFNEIDVGDKTWRMADWQENTENRLKRLEEQFVRNQDLLRKLVQTTHSNAQNLLKPTPRYRKVLKRELVGDGFLLSHPTYGILGTSRLGADSAVEADHFIIQYENKLEEEFVDVDFKSTNTTATWTTTGSADFTAGEIAESESVDYNNGTVSSATLTATEVSGSFDYEMTADGSNWESVTSGTAHAFTDTGTDLRWRATENDASTGEISQINIESYH